jgi:hypothetical protein
MALIEKILDEVIPEFAHEFKDPVLGPLGINFV